MPKVKKETKKITKKITKKVVKKTTKKTIKKEEKYLEATGRRKKAVARVRAWTKGKSEILVNGKSYKEYFPTKKLQDIVITPLEKMNCFDKFKIKILAKGGGVHGQAEAARHGITRILVLFNPDFRKRLKKTGYLTRDPRMKERKKFGLKRARRAPQWKKR